MDAPAGCAFRRLTVIKPDLTEHVQTPHGNPRDWGANTEIVSDLNRMAQLWCPGMAIQMLSYKAADKGIRCDVFDDDDPNIAVGREMVHVGKQVRAARRAQRRPRNSARSQFLKERAMALKFAVPELKTAVDMAIEAGTSECDDKVTQREATRKATTAATIVRGVGTELGVQLTETDWLVEAKRAAKWEQRDVAEGPSPETGSADAILFATSECIPGSAG